MDITKVFGLNVRQHRKKNNFSQENLASMSDLHRTYIGAVERGERNITLLNAEKIAVALDVDIRDLFLDIKNGK